MRKSNWQIIFGLIAVLALATTLWFRYFPAQEQYEKVNFTDVAIVDYCALKDSPRSYDGKIIRLKTSLRPDDMHGWYLYNQDCLGEGDEAKTAIKLYEPKREEIESHIRQLAKSRPAGETLNFTIVGRFTYKNFIGYNDGMDERTHLQFEMHTIEFAAR